MEIQERTFPALNLWSPDWFSRSLEHLVREFESDYFSQEVACVALDKLHGLRALPEEAGKTLFSTF